MKPMRFFLRLLIGVAITVVAMSTGLSQPAVPMLINYQGELRLASTGLLAPDGTYDVTFRIYDVESGGAPTWEGIYSDANGNAIQVGGGIFSVLLGSGTGNALDVSIFDGADRWLEIEVGHETLSPRQRIPSVAYAMRSEDSHLLDGRESLDFAEAGHTHSGADIVTGVVSEARLASEIARDNEIMPRVLSEDGSGSTLDADLLDGRDSTDYASASHTHDGADIATGTVAEKNIDAALARDSEVIAKFDPATGHDHDGTDSKRVSYANLSDLPGEFPPSGHEHSGNDITSGTVADGRIAATIARDSEVDSKITTHAAITDAHHAKTTSFTELTDAAADAQIPAAIARDSEIMPTVLGNDGTGSTLDADRLDGKDSADFAAASHNHSGVDITSGTVADGRIAATIARDTEVDSKVTTHAGVADAHHTKTTTFGELTGTATDAQIPATIARDSEVTSGIATHTGIADAHHTRYTNSEAVAAMGAKANTNPLNHDKTTSFSELTGAATDAQIPNNITINYAASAGDADTVDGVHAAALEESAEIDTDIAAHAGIADAHHTRYTNSEAVAAMGAKANTNPLNHDKTTSFGELTGMATDAQIPATIARDSEVTSGIATHAGIPDAHHARYTDTEAVSAMGAKADTNPLHHDKTTSFSGLTGTATDAQIPAAIARDTEVDSKITAHTAIASAHHTKTTTFTELTGTASDAQIPATIARDSEVTSQIGTHAAIADAHHARYTDTEAVAAMGVKANTNPLNHDKTTTFSQLTGTLSDGQIPASIARDSEIMPTVLAGDGPGSTLNADFLDGISSSGFAPAAHMHDGIFWERAGNSGTSPPVDFLGTLDNQPLELRVNGVRALRLEPGTDPIFPSPNLIGGLEDNWLTPGVEGAVIGGGGNQDTGSGPNRVTDDYGSVGGGANNQAGDAAGTTDDAKYATVGGGEGNMAVTLHATVGGGWLNGASGVWAAVGGGALNFARAAGATVGGGNRNRADDILATVGGGVDNCADGRWATVGGGQQNTASGDHATVSGGADNAASGGNATVGGGEWNEAAANYATIAGGGPSDLSNRFATRNRVTDDYGTIGGGGYNQAGDAAGTTEDATYATVSGGYFNAASGYSATVGGGIGNAASGDSDTVGGGYYNTASGWGATVAGGSLNDASGSDATVGGGYFNTASGLGATVAGGSVNDASGRNATIGGGYWSIASGARATVGGGSQNEATDEYATVSGGQYNYAQAKWATIGGGGPSLPDNPLISCNYVLDDYGTVGGGGNNRAGDGEGTTADRWFATVGGGAHNRATGSYSTVPGGRSNTADGNCSFAAGNNAGAYHEGSFVWADCCPVPELASTGTNQFIARAAGGVWFYTNGALTAGVKVNTGASSWSSVSDRALKRNIRENDGKEILSRLSQVPICRWSYKAQDPVIEHIGPMAQDFYAAFGLGEDDKHISTVDADGVALAAIQGLHKLVQEKDAKISSLESRIEALETLIEKLAESQTGGE